ncbi:MAG: hypothetical protein ACRDQU_17260, partial [Pseudonocardiaceae bacterium]
STVRFSGLSVVAQFFRETDRRQSRRAVDDSSIHFSGVVNNPHRLNLAVFRRALGQRAQARALSAATVDELAGWLGADHPWTLAATINHAHAIGHDGNPEGSRELLRSAYDDCLDYLPPDHPYTRRAADNLTSDIADWGDLHVDLP